MEAYVAKELALEADELQLSHARRAGFHHQIYDANGLRLVLNGEADDIA
jgi:hypothetical protein